MIIRKTISTRETYPRLYNSTRKISHEGERKIYQTFENLKIVNESLEKTKRNEQKHGRVETLRERSFIHILSAIPSFFATLKIILIFISRRKLVFQLLSSSSSSSSSRFFFFRLRSFHSGCVGERCRKERDFAASKVLTSY